MAETTESHGPADTESRSAASDDKHVHHGRTAAAWVGSLLAMLATILGGIAVMVQNWVMFGIAAAIMVIGLIGAKILQATGHGAR
jgi:predicted lipid-binding transport protein (Tim44 family)